MMSERATLSIRISAQVVVGEGGASHIVTSEPDARFCLIRHLSAKV